MTKCIGNLKTSWAKLIGVDIKSDLPIMLGDSNIEHMRTTHSLDYFKYGKFIELIVQQPDYIGRNPKDNSIELVKEFYIDNEYVKIAVRTSSVGVLYARSLYVLNKKRTENFINKGTLIHIDKAD